MTRTRGLLLVLVAAGCDGASPALTDPLDIPGRELMRPASPPAGEIRVLVLHDMEGLSWQDDPRTFFYGEELYPTGQGYASLLQDVVRDHPDGAAPMRGNRQRLLARWFEVESGRWSPPAMAAVTARERQYHGAN